MDTLYNRYIPAGTDYQPVSTPPPSRHDAQRPPPPPPPKGAGPLEGVTGWLGGLLKGIHPEEMDSGDILLILILLFLFLESDDNLELVITLGLLLVFGLFGKKDESETEDHSSP